MKKIIRHFPSLTIISGVCAAVLAYVNSVTAEPIKATAEANEQKAVKAVMPEGVASVEASGDFFVGKSAEVMNPSSFVKSLTLVGTVGMSSLFANTVSE